MRAATESESESELGSMREVNFAGHGDVAIHRGVIIPIHLQVVGQVGPTVVGAYITAGKLQKTGARRHREVNVVAVRHQKAPALLFHNDGIVMPAANFQMRRTYDIQMKPALPFRGNVKRGVNEQAVQVRVADDHLLNRVPALGIRIGDLETKSIRID